MIRVLIVDGEDLMRAGLRELLANDPSIDVVGEAATGREAVAQARRLAPDVALMDVRMPDLDGIAATRELSHAAPRTRVLILTTFEQDDYIFPSLRAGASGFLLKRTRPEEFIAAVQTIAAGDSLLSPSVTRRVIDRMAHQPVPELASHTQLAALTPRERAVLELVACGLANREIAATLTVEESTVRTHMKRILMKLGLRDRVQAVIFAYETGISAPGRQVQSCRPVTIRPGPCWRERRPSPRPQRAHRRPEPSPHHPSGEPDKRPKGGYADPPWRSGHRECWRREDDRRTAQLPAVSSSRAAR
jgi:DNA-binding NarL/FixJ family response regulator